MSAFLLSALLGSALLHAMWNAVIKGGSDKLFETVMKACTCSLLALCALFFLPLPEAASWPCLLGSVGCHLVYYLLLSFAYKGADMSYAYTIMRGSSPLFTALVAVGLLGDAVSPGGWAGVLLLSAGSLTLALDSLRRGLFRLAPTIMALANALVIMGYTVLDGTGVRVAGNALAYICWVFFLNGFPVLFFALFRSGAALLPYMRGRWKQGLFAGCCSIVSYGLSVWAMSRAPISLVAALRETSVLFGMLIAVLYLKEKFSAARLVSVLLVAAGAASIKLFS
jgi:drug/metabolite transporter (DMT)-like permease